MSTRRGVPQPKKIEVFDDFRAYKLAAIKSLNKGVFNLEKPFIPLVVCNNLPQLYPHYHIHNGQYKIIKDLSFINKLIESNGGFNFSLFSFDVSQFILSPGFYVKNQELTIPYNAIEGFSYSHDIYDPAGNPPVTPNPIFTIPPYNQDTGSILVYLEV